MILVERHIINKKHLFYDECDKLCFLSKNLYNSGLYSVRQYYFKNKKYLSYNENYHLMKKTDDYQKLPRKVSCLTLKKIEKNFKSFFVLLKNKEVKKKIPKYLDKVNGRFLITFPKQSLSKREFIKSGKIRLSKTDILINTKIEDFIDIAEVRIVPRIDHFIIEVAYNKEKRINNGTNLAGIDGGLNNLATVGLTNKNHFIINGKPLKSINQFYNKKRAILQGELKKKNNKLKSKKLNNLTYKRNNKINDYLHKASRLLVNQLVLNDVKTLVIGKNVNMKQDINLGKVNNQNFVNLPLFRFLEMVKYKSEMEGITVQYQEESYTSKCSFMDDEPIMKHEKYSGKRIKRGLFRRLNGKLINADLNGSLNILKKAIPDAFGNGIEGFGVNPIKLLI